MFVIFFCLKSAYLKKIPGDNSDKWKQIPNCENVRTTQCVFPKNTFRKGIYLIRVRASDGNTTSVWSKEEKFDTQFQSKPVVFTSGCASLIWYRVWTLFFRVEHCVCTFFFLVTLLPPVIAVKSTNDVSLRVYISATEESENRAMNHPYSLTYEIVFWENTSNAEVKNKTKQKNKNRYMVKWVEKNNNCKSLR